jgi:hypothetical protein
MALVLNGQLGLGAWRFQVLRRRRHPVWPAAGEEGLLRPPLQADPPRPPGTGPAPSVLSWYRRHATVTVGPQTSPLAMDSRSSLEVSLGGPYPGEQWIPLSGTGNALVPAFHGSPPVGSGRQGLGMHRMTRGEVVYRLPGEPDDSTELAEVEHWQLVHRELAIACDEMLGQLPSQALTSGFGLAAMSSHSDWRTGPSVGDS